MGTAGQAQTNSSPSLPRKPWSGEHQMSEETRKRDVTKHDNHTQEQKHRHVIQGVYRLRVDSNTHVSPTLNTHSHIQPHYALSHAQQIYTEKETRCVFTVFQGGGIPSGCRHQAWCWHSGCLWRPHWDASLSSTPLLTGPVTMPT